MPNFERNVNLVGMKWLPKKLLVKRGDPSRLLTATLRAYYNHSPL